jgi:hypothetical protein
MKARRLRIVFAGALLAAAAALLTAGCQTEDPPEAVTFLRVRLNDSLARYERVLVQILDRNDSTKVLFTLWNAPLKSPASDIPGYNLKNLGTQSFIVKVMGYKAKGQLALQTLIFYDAGVRTVLHGSVPKLKPLNWLEALSPSVSALDPHFHPDSLRYTVTMPQGVTSLTFNLTAATPTADLRVDGEPTPSGSTTKIFQVGATPDSLLITVTDTATDAALTRSYRVKLVPTPPPGLYLSSLAPSYGSFTTAFKSDVTLYVFNMDPDKDTVSFVASPVDTRTMTVTVDNQAVFPGKKSQVITVPAGGTYTVGVEVHRGNDLGYYQVTLDHTRK